jgi:hypothetical protein
MEGTEWAKALPEFFTGALPQAKPTTTFRIRTGDNKDRMRQQRVRKLALEQHLLSAVEREKDQLLPKHFLQILQAVEYYPQTNNET